MDAVTSNVGNAGMQIVLYHSSMWCLGPGGGGGGGGIDFRLHETPFAQ